MGAFTGGAEVRGGAALVFVVLAAWCEPPEVPEEPVPSIVYERWSKGGKSSKPSGVVPCADLRPEAPRGGLGYSLANVRFSRLEGLEYGHVARPEACDMSLFWVGATTSSVLQKELSRAVCRHCLLRVVDGLTLVDSTLHLLVHEQDGGLGVWVDERWRPDREALTFGETYVGFALPDGGHRAGTASSECPDGGVSRDCFHVDVFPVEP
jgi:hypothetical protein